MKLRTDVFVVEQQCAYPELDSLDNLHSTIHLLGFDQYTLVAYARAMPIVESTHLTGTTNMNPANDTNDTGDTGDTDKITAVRIGRVVVRQSHRGTGLADQLMQRLINHLEKS